MPSNASVCSSFVSNGKSHFRNCFLRRAGEVGGAVDNVVRPSYSVRLDTSFQNPAKKCGDIAYTVLEPTVEKKWRSRHKVSTIRVMSVIACTKSRDFQQLTNIKSQARVPLPWALVRGECGGSCSRRSHARKSRCAFWKRDPLGR